MLSLIQTKTALIFWVNTICIKLKHEKIYKYRFHTTNIQSPIFNMMGVFMARMSLRKLISFDFALILGTLQVVRSISVTLPKNSTI